MKIKFLFLPFVMITILFFSACSHKTRSILTHTLNDYEKKIDSFSLLLNTFSDTSLDTVILKMKNLEQEFSQEIILYHNKIDLLFKDLKTIPKNHRHLYKKYIQLQLKANLLLQKIISVKTRKIIARLEEVKLNLNHVYHNSDILSADSLSDLNDSHFTEINQAIRDVQDRMVIQLDSLNRQFLELKQKDK